MCNIPSLLTTISGEKITNAVDWETFRRKEIIKLYEEYVFGVRDIERPDNLRFEKKSEKLACDMKNYLETDGDVDITNTAVIGHSRGGKTALWTAATDTRFKLAVSNNSGCMGAALLRGKEGEHIKDINMTDWFCDNFKTFNEREEMLPVDQHMLLSLIAPRFIYVTSSSDDTWADPKAEFKSCHMANEAYNLYGCMKGIEAPLDGPELEVPYHEGHIAYHIKSGGHSITQYDWDNVMSYFEKIIQL